MIPRVLRARTLPAWLSGLGLFLLAALSPGLALASIPNVSTTELCSEDAALPQLPSTLDDIERREGERAACGVFCGEPLKLGLRVGLGSKTPSLITQDAWGNFRFPSELSASKNRFAFTGYEWDPELGLFNAKARYFDPQIGRFTSQDSFLGQIDDPPSLHRYFYANDNPTRFIDPTGHLSWDQVKSGWAAIKAEAARPFKDFAQQGRDLIGAVESATDKSNVGFGLMFGVQMAGRAAQEPERFARDTKDLVTPGRLPDGSSGGYMRTRQVQMLDAAEKLPLGDRIGLTLDAWGMQPGVIAEEGFARPLAQVPGQLSSAQQHLEQAVLAKDSVDRAVHAAAAVRDASLAAQATLAVVAPFEGGEAPSRLSGASEMAPYRGARVPAESGAPRITDPARLLTGSIDDAIAANYQRYYTEAARDVTRAFNLGKIEVPVGTNWEQVLGGRIDAIARARLRNFLGREGIAERPGADVLVNRRLNDPSGSGAYRIPDVMLKNSRRILDGTIGSKTLSSPQIQDFVTFSGGYSVDIVRPDVAPYRK